MHLTRLVMDVTAQGARRDLKNCQELHRTVMSAFANTDAQDARRHYDILYRLVPYGGSKYILYVQSMAKPQVSRWLNKGYLYPLQEGNILLKISNPTSFIKEGMLLNFDLLACPSKITGTSTKQERLNGNRRNGQRVPLRTAEERLEWLTRKAEAGGFKLLETWEAGNHTTYGTNKSNKKGKMYHVGVHFLGTLIVTDCEKFILAMQHGIGPAKAYGYGLLMVKQYSV